MNILLIQFIKSSRTAKTKPQYKSGQFLPLGKRIRVVNGKGHEWGLREAGNVLVLT